MREGDRPKVVDLAQYVSRRGERPRQSQPRREKASPRMNLPRHDLSKAAEYLAQDLANCVTLEDLGDYVAKFCDYIQKPRGFQSIIQSKTNILFSLTAFGQRTNLTGDQKFIASFELIRSVLYADDKETCLQSMKALQLLFNQIH
jgi:hypothetical protein